MDIKQSNKEVSPESKIRELPFSRGVQMMRFIRNRGTAAFQQLITAKPVTEFSRMLVSKRLSLMEV